MGNAQKRERAAFNGWAECDGSAAIRRTTCIQKPETSIRFHHAYCICYEFRSDSLLRKTFRMRGYRNSSDAGPHVFSTSLKKNLIEFQKCLWILLHLSIHTMNSVQKYPAEWQRLIDFVFINKLFVWIHNRANQAHFTSPFTLHAHVRHHMRVTLVHTWIKIANNYCDNPMVVFRRRWWKRPYPAHTNYLITHSPIVFSEPNTSTDHSKMFVPQK